MANERIDGLRKKSDYWTNRPAWFHYIVAIVIVAVAFAVRVAFLRTLGMHNVYLTFYPAVIIATLYGGLSAGLLATVFSALLVNYFWIEPVGSLIINNPSDMVGIAVFLASCTMITLITEAMHRARIRSGKVAAEAESHRESEITIEFLRLVNASTGTRDLIRKAATFFQEQSGCEAFGIRLKEEDDYPYYEARGFSKEFILLENSLCSRDHAGHIIRDSVGDPLIECMCGNVICGRFDPSKHFFTAKGSFWTNSTTELLASTNDADRQTRTRNRCNGEGYESVALIPLRVGQQRLGLIQLNDRRKGLYSPEIIALWERFADYLAVALAKFRAEELARQQADLLRLSFDAIISWRLDGVIESWNRGAGELYGFTEREAVGRSSHELLQTVYPVPWSEIESILNDSGKWDGDLIHRTRDGREVIVSARYQLIHGADGVSRVIESGRDITERKKLEAQLLQSQKMESVGLLAGGIAHNINNILGAMMGFTTLLQMEIKEGHPARDILDHLPPLTDRAATLIKGLMAFSRKQVLEMRPTSINDIVSTIWKVLSKVIGEDVKLNIILSAGDIAINGDAMQIEQALMNLATNARDAMPDGGNLTITTESFEMDDNFIQMHGYGKPGRYAMLSVEDTGIGMAEETRRRIFEPFFTTKGVGKGTGLGLAMVYGTIREHAGYIDVCSEAGKGTTFRIYLPAIDIGAADEKKADGPMKGGAETILLVEDEASLRMVTRSMLQTFGYKVIEAEDGNDAVNKFNERHSEIDLVIMDVIMPNKSGKGAYSEMRKIRPDVKVIFTSGHSGDILTSKRIAEEGLHFISKPVSSRELFDKIRNLLDK